jgi:hypothetical protein
MRIKAKVLIHDQAHVSKCTELLIFYQKTKTKIFSVSNVSRQFILKPFIVPIFGTKPQNSSSPKSDS